MLAKTLDLEGGVDCEIPYRLGRKRNIFYKGVETSP